MSLHKTWPGWPSDLSLSGWNKQKGLLAKLVKGETGIGAKITEAKAAYDSIGAAYFSDGFVDVSTKTSCDKALRAAAAETAKLKACTDKLAELAKLATEKADSFKGPLIPKNTVTYTRNIGTGAKAFAATLQAHCVAAMKEIKEEQKTAA